jgi:hypothetical protein
MKTRNFLTLAFFCFAMTTVMGQGKKEIKDNKIVSETSYITSNENGKEVTYKDSYMVYDKNGCVTEQTDFNKEGGIKRKETNKYNANKDKIEEVVYDGKDKTTQKTTYFYNSEYQKIGEIEYDGSGLIKKQSLITYNRNGMKAEKKTYDANKKLISTKKFIYTTK